MLAERIIRGTAALQLQLVSSSPRRSKVSVFVRSVHGGRNDRFDSSYRFPMKIDLADVFVFFRVNRRFSFEG